MDKSYLMTLKYNENEIICIRKKVRSSILSESVNIISGDVTQISVDDLKLIFKLYDNEFLNDYFKNNFNGILEFSLSKKLTKSAGVTVKYKPAEGRKIEKYEIKIGVNFFFRFNELNRSKQVNGLYAEDSLDALMLVMEHEICHLIEFHIFSTSNCGGRKFKDISSNLFGHMGRYHQLPTNAEIAFEKYGLKAGDSICFEHKGQIIKGIIYRINVRATVMVRENGGQYHDNKGNRYNKWYVPVAELRKI